MPAAQKTLTRALIKSLGPEAGLVPFPKRKDLLASSALGEIDRIYRLLGGILAEPPLHVRKWDMVFHNTAIELDEEQHFNRYRAITLTSHAYQDLPLFPHAAYTVYCDDHEHACLKKARWGKYCVSP